MADQKKKFPELTKATLVQDIALGMVYQDGAPMSAPLPAMVGGFKTLADLTADTALTYSTVAAGSVVIAGYDRYEVVASGTASPDVTTAGGVKLNLLSGGVSEYLPLTGGTMTGYITHSGGTGTIWVSGDGLSSADASVHNDGVLNINSTAGADFSNGLKVDGVDVQVQDAELTAIAGLTSAANKVPYFTGSGTASMLDLQTTLTDSDTSVPTSGAIVDYVASGVGAYVPLAGGDMTGDLTRDGANIGLPEITTGNTSRSFALTDVGNLVTVDTTSGAVVLTVNPNATTALPLVSIIHIALTDSTNSLTITAGTGVTINSITAGSAIVTSTDGSEVSLMKIATNEWLAVGNIGVFS